MSRARSLVGVGWALAATLLVSGLGSIASTLYPFRLGNPDWEFGTVGELAATVSLAVMGLTAALAVSLYDRRRVPMIVIGLVALALGAVGFLSLGVLAMDVPIVLNAASNARPEFARSVKVVLVKSAVLLTMFSAGLFTVGLGAIRSYQRSR